MTTRMTRLVCVLMGLFPVVAATGTAADGPEQLGAHWARLSDKAQIELMLDGLRSATRGGAAERIMMRNAQAGNDVLRSAAQGERAGVSNVTVRDDAAIASFSGTGPVRFERTGNGWRAVSGVIPASIASGTTATVAGQTAGFSAGATFIATAVSRDQGIDRLSRSVTRAKLGRTLFGTPGPSASYYAAHYMRDAPYVAATYVQFVVDPTWNRLVYGNMNRWIKSYENLIGPTSVAVDPSGRVFVGEAGRQQVTVLQLEGEGDETQLRQSFTITGMSAPTALAHSDNGTPLDPTDDCLYVADAARGAVLKYRLGPTGGVLASSFSGFDSPTAIVAGRWNGSNNGFIYVVDQVAKRVRVLEDTGGSLALVAEHRGGFDSYYSSLSTDHFGNVYLADNTSSRLLKLTASLEVLDEEGGEDTFAALAVLDIPFGRITIDGVGTFWAGFDQLFALERWSDASGAQRRTLGLRLKDILFTTDPDVSTIAGRFVLTDFGVVGVRVVGANGNLVRSLGTSAMVSGRKEIVWDRRDESGRFVPPGEYRYEIVATSSYRDEATKAAARWSLPLYYEERGGMDEPHLIRGTPLQWGGHSAAQDDDFVQYRFSGLDPSSSYAVSAEYMAPDNVARVQDMTAGAGIRLHAPAPVGPSGTTIDFVTIPPAAFSSGELLLTVNRRAAGSAVVSRIVLKETGKGFSSQPDGAAKPTKYALEQNYPNPFNPSTVIRYDLPEGGPVSLTVYDISGRQIAELVNEMKPAGTYEVRFEAGRVQGGGLASGVYFYRVRAGNFSQTRKMLLLK